MNDNYESLKAKLRKLAALAERGVGGEATNARRLMEQICREHGVSLDEVLNVEETKWYDFEIGRRIFAAAALRDSLNDVSYCKLIER